jgi:hypothetical protein
MVITASSRRRLLPLSIGSRVRFWIQSRDIMVMAINSTRRRPCSPTQSNKRKKRFSSDQLVWSKSRLHVGGISHCRLCAIQSNRVAICRLYSVARSHTTHVLRALGCVHPLDLSLSVLNGLLALARVSRIRIGLRIGIMPYSKDWLSSRNDDSAYDSVSLYSYLSH